MDEIVKVQLLNVIERVDGLDQLIVTDRDGVPVVNVGRFGTIFSQVNTANVRC